MNGSVFAGGQYVRLPVVPGFKAYAFSHKPKGPLEKVYFSLGNKECKTRNPLLQTVQENTQAIEALYQCSCAIK